MRLHVSSTYLKWIKLEYCYMIALMRGLARRVLGGIRRHRSDWPLVTAGEESTAVRARLLGAVLMVLWCRKSWGPTWSWGLHDLGGYMILGSYMI